MDAPRGQIASMCLRYARADAVVTREILGETLLVPISADIADMSNIFALNETGAWIWERLDGSCPLSVIRDALVEAFDVSPETAWDDLRELLGELDASGLVRPADRETGS